MRSANTTAKSRTVPRRHQPAVARVHDDSGVKREIRLALFEKAVSRLLSEGEDRDCVIFELRGRPDYYVQFILHDGALLGEVGSRGWAPDGEWLDRERITALGCLGFEGGGHRANFARDHLPQDGRRLACLTELLFGAAYRPQRDFDITVITKPMIEREGMQRRAQEVDA